MEIQSLLTAMRPLGHPFSLKTKNFTVVSRQKDSTKRAMARKACKLVQGRQHTSIMLETGITCCEQMTVGSILDGVLSTLLDGISHD